MPRHPKPVPMRANREHRDIGLVPSGGLSPPPPRPPGLLPSSRTAWTAFWDSPLARLTVPVDHEAIRRLFEMRDMQKRFRLAGKKRPVVEGSQGQMVLNPLLKAASDLEPQVLALEDRFAGSLLSRLKLGVVFGDAARSLEDLNAELAADDLEDEPDDPRLLIVDGSSG